MEITSRHKAIEERLIRRTRLQLTPVILSYKISQKKSESSQRESNP